MSDTEDPQPVVRCQVGFHNCLWSGYFYVLCAWFELCRANSEGIM